MKNDNFADDESCSCFLIEIKVCNSQSGLCQATKEGPQAAGWASTGGGMSLRVGAKLGILDASTVFEYIRSCGKLT